MIKVKKINTIPNGQVIILLIFLILILTLIIGLMLIPKLESVGVFVFSLIFLFALIDYISTKHLNYIYVTDDEIWHNKTRFNWENIFITMKHSNPRFSRNSFDYYFYFSDHYLSDIEIKSKHIKKSGFYIALTKNRALYILMLYKKEVMILNQSLYGEKILEVVTNHNKSIS